MDIQRLRNLTTGRLHTKMEDVYEDLEKICGERGLFTHMLPNMNKAIQPWLKGKVTDPKFWEDVYDPSHTGEFELSDATAEERALMIARYVSLPHPLMGMKS